MVVVTQTTSSNDGMIAETESARMRRHHGAHWMLDDNMEWNGGTSTTLSRLKEVKWVLPFGGRRLSAMPGESVGGRCVVDFFCET